MDRIPKKDHHHLIYTGNKGSVTPAESVGAKPTAEWRTISQRHLNLPANESSFTACRRGENDLVTNRSYLHWFVCVEVERKEMRMLHAGNQLSMILATLFALPCECCNLSKTWYWIMLITSVHLLPLMDTEKDDFHCSLSKRVHQKSLTSSLHSHWILMKAKNPKCSVQEQQWKEHDEI